MFALVGMITSYAGGQRSYKDVMTFVVFPDIPIAVCIFYCNNPLQYFTCLEQHFQDVTKTTLKKIAAGFAPQDTAMKQDVVWGTKKLIVGPSTKDHQDNGKRVLDIQGVRLQLCNDLRMSPI